MNNPTPEQCRAAIAEFVKDVRALADAIEHDNKETFPGKYTADHMMLLLGDLVLGTTGMVGKLREALGISSTELIIATRVQQTVHATRRAAEAVINAAQQSSKKGS